jgi:threonylcarbamoyladenosine tRNA methylthiotransferase MtaB
MFFRLFTLGCKVNRYETEYVRAGLLRLGYVEASPEDIADFVLVNTCTVTAESDLKSRKAIRKFIKENPGAEVVVMGCSVTHDPQTITKIDGVSQIIADKKEVPAFLQRLGLAELPTGIESFGERHRAFVKIQDGCRVGCSYCVIPKVRPVLRSRMPDDVLAEVQTLVQNGYREIVLTGIHLGHYGVDLGIDLGGTSQVAALVRQIIALPESFRIRLSSLEAVEVSEELVDLLRQNPNRICPHLHLSMQSGSDAVLRRMKRRWLSEPFIRCCEKIAAQLDRPALTTDVIVGFPGETEEQFEETCRVVEQLRFSKVHIFRFSPRKGTEAATFPDRVSPQVQKDRAEHLAVIAAKIRAEYAASFVGQTQTVLIETPFTGTSDRYLEVRFSEPQQPGSLVETRIIQTQGDVLLTAKYTEHT